MITFVVVFDLLNLFPLGQWQTILSNIADQLIRTKQNYNQNQNQKYFNNNNNMD